MAGAINWKDEALKYQSMIESIADMPEREAKLAISRQAQIEAAEKGALAVTDAEHRLQAEVAAYNKVKPYDHVVGQFIENNATATAAFGNEGLTGVTYGVQQQIPLPAGAGIAAWGKASIAHDAKGNVTGGDIGVNLVNTPERIGPVDVVAIASVNAHINEKGQIRAEDATLLAGAVIKEHGKENPVNFTAAAITNANFNTFTGYGRLSRDFQATENLTATPFVAAAHNFTSEKTGVDAGARLSYDLKKGDSVFITPTVSVADVAGNPSLGGTTNIGYAWGGC